MNRKHPESTMNGISHANSQLNGSHMNGISAGHKNPAIDATESIGVRILNGVHKINIFFWDKLWWICWNLYYFVHWMGLWNAFWTPFYKFLRFVFHNNAAPFKFINFGYVPITDEDHKALEPVRKQLDACVQGHRTHIQLYEKTLSTCPLYASGGLAGLDMLEIGCGHGGGIEWLHSTHTELKSVRGMDRTIMNTMDGLVFEGDANDIPLGKDCIDIIVNVESSHCYESQPKFFEECFRILRPGGYLQLSDFRPYGNLRDLLFEHAKEAGFQEISWEVITENVLRSTAIQAKVLEPMFNSTWYMRMMNPLWNNFFATPGTAMHREMTARRFEYYAVCWRKPLTNQ